MIVDPESLYRKYREELLPFSQEMRRLYYMMQRGGYGTTFADFEGELLYMLVRETRPDVAVEISPNAGWSTNYILAALTANRHGMLHSFEIERKIGGRPTEEVIRDHQISRSDQGRLTVHIGDAREMVPRVVDSIDLLLMDSCHEDWFAEWYVSSLFPMVRGPVLIQDIAFRNRLEPSSEARFVWDWIAKNRVAVDLVGEMEQRIERTVLRCGFAERRGLRCNSIVLTVPFIEGSRPILDSASDDFIREAQEAAAHGEKLKAICLLDTAMADLKADVARVERHRPLMKAARLYGQLGERAEARRCCQRALGVVLGLDRMQRVKALPELVPQLAKRRQWRLFLQALSLAVSEPGARLPLARSFLRFFR